MAWPTPLFSPSQEGTGFQRVPRPASEPPSPSVSRTSTPAHSDVEDNELDSEEADSEEEREELSRISTPQRGMTPSGSSGSLHSSGSAGFTLSDGNGWWQPTIDTVYRFIASCLITHTMSDNPLCFLFEHCCATVLLFLLDHAGCSLFIPFTYPLYSIKHSIQ